MLNLSSNRTDISDFRNQYQCISETYDRSGNVKILRTWLIVLFSFFIALFLPWTQNVRAPGALTTLYPDQRPQTIQSIIPGRIERWYVRDGQFVEKGDTIVQISEIRDDFFDPELLDRTKEQIDAKSNSAINYKQKTMALSSQIAALEKNKINKLEQAKNKYDQSKFKLASDSIDYVAAQIDYKIANERVKRMEELFEKGLKSLTDLETRKLNVQEAQASLISAENKVLSARNEVLNARIELSAIVAEYDEKLGKAMSERNSAFSDYYDTEAQVAKLENQFSSFEVRINAYYITAAQRGYVTQTITAGVGETIKEGTQLVSIMPAEYDLAAEIYVEPIDFPLLKAGRTVRLLFDGWPAIVFSGWPQISNGTFGGTILAIDNFISPNGMYRVLVVPDENDVAWPEDLRVGSGSDAIILLNDVPVWYELWRQLNGFPPDYYSNLRTEKKAKEDK
jgi:multidrug resistance efflux pump